MFGTGLLEDVSQDAVLAVRALQPAAVRGEPVWRDRGDGQMQPGRLGWQADAVSVEDQTSRAFARDMGLTSQLRKRDDCTDQQTACRAAPQGGAPEVSDAFMRAMVEKWTQTLPFVSGL